VEFVEPVIPPPAFEVYEGTSPIELEQSGVVKTRSGRASAAAQLIAKEGDFKADIAFLLGSRSGLREAIILREIFGPPRSLQPFDVVESA
jgi:hypothetical protein